MNIIDQLMKYDLSDIELPKKTKRLYLKKLKAEFEFPLQAITPELLSEIQDSMFVYKASKSNSKMEATTFNGKVRTVAEGCPEVFKNQALMKKFGAQTPYELVPKLLELGEIEELQEEIEKLSGYEDSKGNKIDNAQAVEEVKN